MPKGRKTDGNSRSPLKTKYDAHNVMLDKTYGAWADFRRELSDSRTAIEERKALLEKFARCSDSQSAFLLLDDYFEQISLSRRDFAGSDWWPNLLKSKGKARLEATALLFLRAKRPLPAELMAYTNRDRLAALEEAEKERELVAGLENWLLSPKPVHLDAPRASVRAVCEVGEFEENPPLKSLVVRLILFRTRRGKKVLSLGEIVELSNRSSLERESFPPDDWEFVQWLEENYGDADPERRQINLHGIELLQWLAKWGGGGRLKRGTKGASLRFSGRMAELLLESEKRGEELCFAYVLKIPGKEAVLPLGEAHCFAGQPSILLAGDEFLLLRNAPDPDLLSRLQRKPPVITVGKLKRELVAGLENWLPLPKPVHLDAPRASVRAVCEIGEFEENPPLKNLVVRLVLFRTRRGKKVLSLGEIVELSNRSSSERELFLPDDWGFVQWLGENYGNADPERRQINLHGIELLQWLAKWGGSGRLEQRTKRDSLRFSGQLAELLPQLEKRDEELCFAHVLKIPGKEAVSLGEAHCFAGQPSLILAGGEFFLIRNAPDPDLLSRLQRKPIIAVGKLSHRFLTHLRKNAAGSESHWEELCTTHTAKPQFVFELNNDTVRLRLKAISDVDESQWQWNGHEWQNVSRPKEGKISDGKTEFLDDERLDVAAEWLRRLDWFTPEPGVWIGDADEDFLSALAGAWPDRPDSADYLGNAAFQRLFLVPQRLKPQLVINGSGIDWLSVSAEWEQEGMKLSEADVQQLQSATGRFIKLPNGGWVELDAEAVQSAQETMAELGVDGLANAPQKVSLIHAAQLQEDALSQFGKTAKMQALREKLENFQGVPQRDLPKTVRAKLRPYQKEGFHFLCHLSHLKLGGILADDMGLGKTVQALCWITWQLALKQEKARKNAALKSTASTLVVCPASVLHNWRRETEKFVPHLKILVLESGVARHQLRKQIPQHDLIITNYAILRRDFEALQKFSFGAVILDEAQYIKNPAAQVTKSAKQLRAKQRLALTGTPLENRLLDLWSIVDFVQPGYLGDQSQFTETYEPRGENADDLRKIALKRLSAKLRPLMLRRLKNQVAKDLPERIDERRDCELTEEQRKLYLAELRRSRQQIFKTMKQKGLAKSKMHVLAALTRLRQICCHPQLVGSDAGSGKTDTLIELLEPLLAEGQKVLLFSQFVQMLQILEQECKTRGLPTYLLTGQTKNRMAVVNAFQQASQASVFLLSLRAAGTGLNLTSASYVVLYDPWWNPAVEAQAIDRSHRIGQTRTVNAYRLISPGTVEEKIWELQQKKARTISDVLREEGFARNLISSDLEYLFSED